MTEGPSLSINQIFLLLGSPPLVRERDSSTLNLPLICTALTCFGTTKGKICNAPHYRYLPSSPLSHSLSPNRRMPSSHKYLRCRCATSPEQCLEVEQSTLS